MLPYPLLSEREMLYSKLKDDKTTHSYIEANAKNSCLRTRKWLSIIDECKFYSKFLMSSKALFLFVVVTLFEILLFLFHDMPCTNKKLEFS